MPIKTLFLNLLRFFGFLTSSSTNKSLESMKGVFVKIEFNGINCGVDVTDDIFCKQVACMNIMSGTPYQLIQQKI